MAASRTLSAKNPAIRAAKYVGTGREVEFRIAGNPGLVLVVLAPRRDGTSTKVWRYVYSNTIDGRRTTRKRKIGVYPVITLARAVRVAADIRAEVVSGLDVVAVERQAKCDRQRSELTFTDLVERYFEARRGDELRSLTEIERTIRRDALPVIGHLAPSAVQRQDIEACLRPLADAGKLAMARHLLTYLRGIYNYCLEVQPQLGEDFSLETNPTDRVGRRMRGGAGAYGKPRPRDRVLDDHDIARFLDVLNDPSHGTSETVRAILRVLLLTGQRSKEVRETPISELRLDGDAPVWRLPATRTKNKRAHTVPLAPGVVDVLREQVGRRQSGPVFRARVNPKEFLDKRAPGRALERLFERGLLSVARFSPHDLRRTVETGLARHGVVKEVRDRIQNHVDGSVGGIHYNRHEYEVETRHALERWATHCEALTDKCAAVP